MLKFKDKLVDDTGRRAPMAGETLYFENLAFGEVVECAKAIEEGIVEPHGGVLGAGDHSLVTLTVTFVRENLLACHSDTNVTFSFKTPQDCYDANAEIDRAFREHEIPSGKIRKIYTEVNTPNENRRIDIDPDEPPSGSPLGAKPKSPAPTRDGKDAKDIPPPEPELQDPPHWFPKR